MMKSAGVTICISKNGTFHIMANIPTNHTLFHWNYWQCFIFATFHCSWGLCNCISSIQRIKISLYCAIAGIAGDNNRGTIHNSMNVVERHWISPAAISVSLMMTVVTCFYTEALWFDILHMHCWMNRAGGHYCIYWPFSLESVKKKDVYSYKSLSIFLIRHLNETLIR